MFYFVKKIVYVSSLKIDWNTWKILEKNFVKLIFVVECVHDFMSSRNGKKLKKEKLQKSY